MPKSDKSKLIEDIQQLLNDHKGGSVTHINPTLLEYMDEDELKAIIDDLLRQKERFLETHTEWLDQFKKNNN